MFIFRTSIEAAGAVWRDPQVGHHGEPSQHGAAVLRHRAAQDAGADALC